MLRCLFRPPLRLNETWHAIAGHSIERAIVVPHPVKQGPDDARFRASLTLDARVGLLELPA